MHPTGGLARLQDGKNPTYSATFPVTRYRWQPEKPAQVRDLRLDARFEPLGDALEPLDADVDAALPLGLPPGTDHPPVDHHGRHDEPTAGLDLPVMLRRDSERTAPISE